ncbi:hypothetical protein DFH08DRAFT_804637 [Mycena albidolilacea]|uniref:Uncharacterized protein n=1 Tax=Mycena albidolilacea TaxID=1033008 RepID=A0AAD7A9W6_9AGAR|nr:hypothetical protein DFH08DRAFT_804637 [Mycena albidolilacea]
MWCVTASATLSHLFPTTTPRKRHIASGMNLRLVSPNDEKVAIYQAADTVMRSAWSDEEFINAVNWRSNSGRTCLEALNFFRKVPPFSSGSSGTQTKTISAAEKALTPLEYVISEPNWVDEMVTACQTLFQTTVVSSLHHVNEISWALLAHSQRAPYRGTVESIERETDDFHMHSMLRPAVKIAAAIRGSEELTEAYLKNENGTVGDIGVRLDNKYSIIGENKRAPEFTAHEEKFRGFATGLDKKFPWPQEDKMDKAEPAI